MDKNKQKIYKNIIIVLIIFTGIAIIIGSIYQRNNRNTVAYKNDIPHINVNNESAKTANEIIKELYSDTSADISSNIYKNNKIDSLVICYEVYSKQEEANLVTYIVYNIGNDNTIKSDENLLNIYGFTKEEVISSATRLLMKYYEDETEQGYVDKNDCSFNCYLDFVRNIQNIEDNIKLFVKDNKLKGYVQFSPNSLLDDYEYFLSLDNELYEFEVVHS